MGKSDYADSAIGTRESLTKSVNAQADGLSIGCVYGDVATESSIRDV